MPPGNRKWRGSTLRIAVGFKAHSGWAVHVAIGLSGHDICVIDRRRIELVEPDDAAWAKQPYHAAEGLPAAKARQVVKRGVAAAHRVAAIEMCALVERSRSAGQSDHRLRSDHWRANAGMDDRANPFGAYAHAQSRGHAVPQGISAGGGGCKAEGVANPREGFEHASSRVTWVGRCSGKNRYARQRNRSTLG